MATPVIAGAGAYETLKLIRGEIGATAQVGPLAVGMVASLVAGLAAIHFLLRYLRTNTLTLFVVYRLVLAIVVIVFFLAR
jgi:undecaprenyl-diphosphatase